MFLGSKYPRDHLLPFPTITLISDVLYVEFCCQLTTTEDILIGRIEDTIRRPTKWDLFPGTR